MSKAMKGIGTAIVIVGIGVATAGFGVAAMAGASLTGAAGLAGGTVLSIGGLGVSASTMISAGGLLASFGSAKPPTSSGYSTEWLADTDQAIPFAFGRVGAAGLIINKQEYGRTSENNFTVVGVVSGAGPIQGFVKFSADDRVVTFNGADMATSPSQWAPDRMYFSTRLGAQPDTALLKAAGIDGTLPKWSANHKLSGKASYMVTFVQDKKGTSYPDGEPAPVMVVNGLKAWDPVQDSTYPGGFGPCRLDNPATWVATNNGARFALKWALGLWESPVGKGAPGIGTCVGGIGSSLAGIDVASFVYAASVADANAWTCAAWPATKEDKHTVLTNLLQSAGAVPSRTAGLISCISRGAPQPSLYTVTARDTAGPIELDAATPQLDRINTITPRYWSEAHNWDMVAADPVGVPAYVTEDRGRRPRGVDYPYVPSATQAAQLAALDVVDSREGISGTIPFKPHMRRIKPGDCFTISEPGFVLDGQKVKCWGRFFDPQTATVRIRFRSETDAKFPFVLGVTGVAPPTPSLAASDPTIVPAPGASEWAFTAQSLTESGASIPIVRFDGACANAMADAVVFEYRPVDTPPRPWSGAGIEGPQVTRKEVNQVTPGTAYEGSVQYRINGVLGARLILGPELAGEFIVPGSGRQLRVVSRTPLYPVTSNITEVMIAAHSATLDAYPWSLSLPAKTFESLDPDTSYMVFWRRSTSEYEIYDASDTVRLTDLDLILIETQRTERTGGGFTPPPDPPPGYCAHEDEPLLLADDTRSGPGREIRAGDVLPGDWVWSRHEITGEWGAFDVYAVSSVDDDTCRAVLRDGRRPRFSPGHRLAVGEAYVALTDLDPGAVIDGTRPGVLARIEPAGWGVVVRISVRDAQTYVLAGLLSHNIKMMDRP